jgi:hypothetical protein
MVIDTRWLTTPAEPIEDGIGDPTYADAILDRLSHRIDLAGESMRRTRGKQTRKGRPTTVTKARKSTRFEIGTVGEIGSE